MLSEQTASSYLDKIDWDGIHREALDFLHRYIRIDTSNPPGKELKAARFFEDIFRRESIPVKVYPSSAARGNTVAIIKGTGRLRPLILLNHMDVVPVEPEEEWEVSPFSGKEKDGFIWGRGALDMKSTGIAQLMVSLIVARYRIPLSRDIIFCATADEETGGAAGIEYVGTHSQELMSAELALNEGGGIRLLENGFTCYWIAVSEKVSLRLRINCSGPGGHGSIYRRDNPNLKLISVLQKLDCRDEPLSLIPTVELFFRNMAPIIKEEKFLDIRKAAEDPAWERGLRENSHYDAMVRNTKVITMLRSGKKVNVVPARASASVDCRLVPGNSKETFLRELKEYLRDDSVTIEIIDQGRESPASPIDNPLYRAIEKVARRNDPGSLVTPYMMTGGSDSSYLRLHGIPTYGFAPFRLTQDEKRRVHGKNERISVENMKSGVKALLEILLELEQGE